MLEYTPLCMRIYHMLPTLYYEHLTDASTESLNLITNISLLLHTYLSKCPLVISSQMSDRPPVGLTLNLAFLPKPVLSSPFAISTKGESYHSDHIPRASKTHSISPSPQSIDLGILTTFLLLSPLCPLLSILKHYLIDPHLFSVSPIYLDVDLSLFFTIYIQRVTS